VLEDLPVFRGIGLHRRALDALRRSGNPNHARLAYHAEGAADSEAVLQHAGQAARNATAMEAHREAALQLQRAVRFARGVDDIGRVELLEPLASALFLTGYLEEADRARSEAITLSRRLGDVPRLGNNLRILARYRLFSDGVAAAVPLAEEALAVLSPSGESRELALAFCVLGHIAMIDQRAAEVAVWCARALAAGERLGDQEVISYALNNLGTAELMDGLPEGRQKLERSLAVALAGQVGGEHIDRALINMAETAIHDHDLEVAAERLSEVAEYNAASQIALCNLSAKWAGLLLDRGRWDEAVQHGMLAAEHHKASPAERAEAAIVICKVAVRRDQDNAGPLIAEADRLMRLCTDPDLDLLTAWTSLHAEAAWLAGDLAPAVDELARVEDMAVKRSDAWAIGELGVWLWRAGRLEQPRTRTARPYALQIRGDHRGAAGEWERLGIPYEAASCLSDADDPNDLREAYDRMLQLGALAVAHRVALKLRDRGGVVPRGPRPTTRGNPARLTHREDEVAALLAQGLSNAEIAERLVLSRKTVGHHVSAVLGKLGVRRRGEVASAMDQARLTQAK
jgi:DNA-binding CsgD family transcriptional regulator